MFHFYEREREGGRERGREREGGRERGRERGRGGEREREGGREGGRCVCVCVCVCEHVYVCLNMFVFCLCTCVCVIWFRFSWHCYSANILHALVPGCCTTRWTSWFNIYCLDLNSPSTALMNITTSSGKTGLCPDCVSVDPNLTSLILLFLFLFFSDLSFF